MHYNSAIMTTGTTHRACDTADQPWRDTDEPGLERKPLETSDADRADASLVRLAPGSSLPAAPDGMGFEALVAQGSWRVAGTTLGVGGYARQPDGRAENVTDEGCVLLVRVGPFDDADVEIVHAPNTEDAWVPGHGNLRVRPLHSFGTEGTALVHWPEGERFVPHRHFGGEEIFVISGTFEDEHGRYPAGTWIQSGHGSAHHPFVREETVIFVKTGHLPPS